MVVSVHRKKNKAWILDQDLHLKLVFYKFFITLLIEYFLLIKMYDVFWLQ